MDYTGATPAGLAGGGHLSASPDPQHLSSLAGQPTPPFRLDPLRVEEDRFATVQLIQAFLDLSPEILDGEEPKLVPVLEQPESFPNHLIFRRVETTGDLVVDQALELRGQRDVHCEFLCWFIVGHSVPPVAPSNAQRRPQPLDLPVHEIDPPQVPGTSICAGESHGTYLGAVYTIYAEFVSAFRAAAEPPRQGPRDVPSPAGSFPPAPPFVPS